MVYVFLAPGFEEIEALAPIDILRRADCEVVTVGVGSKAIVGSHGIAVAADVELDDLPNALPANLKMIVLPGGMPGTLNLEKAQKVQLYLKLAAENNLWIGAICAAPSILGHQQFLNGKTCTCFPGYEGELGDGIYTGRPVECDGNIITARGAGVAIEFGLTLAAKMTSQEKAKHLEASLQCHTI